MLDQSENIVAAEESMLIESLGRALLHETQIACDDDSRLRLMGRLPRSSDTASTGRFPSILGFLSELKVGSGCANIPLLKKKKKM